MYASLTLARHTSIGYDDILVSIVAVCKNSFLDRYTQLENTKDISEIVDCLWLLEVEGGING
jgi:hypothetical protein